MVKFGLKLFGGCLIGFIVLENWNGANALLGTGFKGLASIPAAFKT
jgi:hypothetical protein